MYERIFNKNETPSMEIFLSHIGKRKALFEVIDVFLSKDLNSIKTIKFDAHSRCWKINYNAKKEYICDIIAEHDAFTIITRLAEENIKKAYDDVSQYAKECIDNSPFRHRGWIEYRVLDSKHLDDAKIMLCIRTSGKQKSIG